MNALLETSDDWNVEVSAETADRAEEVLREFATDAELDLALIVDVGGGLVAGVATRPDVQVDTVGALVAGAFGAMRAMAGELGESSLVESVHHGARDVIHLRDINGQFILLGLTERALPAGLIRVKAAQVSARLAELLAHPAGPSRSAEERQEGAPAPLAPPDEEDEKSPRTTASEGLPNPAGSASAVPGAVLPQERSSAAAPPPTQADSRLTETEKPQPEGQDASEPMKRSTSGEGTAKPAGGKYVFEIR